MPTDAGDRTPHRPFVLSEEEQLVREAAGKFVAERMPIGFSRALRDEDSRARFDAAVWSRIGRPRLDRHRDPGGLRGKRSGCPGARGDHRGNGQDARSVPFASTALVAATVIGRYAAADAAARWLPGIAAGTLIAALAVDEGSHDGPAGNARDLYGGRTSPDRHQALRGGWPCGQSVAGVGKTP